MNPTAEHPSLRLPVTDADRHAAELRIREAHSQGRLSDSEFDRRLGQIAGASTRRDLNATFLGLIHVPAAALDRYGPELREPSGNRPLAAIAHFTSLISWIIGPGLIFLLAEKGTYAKREAAKAFNFQVIATVGLVVGGILSAAVLTDPVDTILFPILWLGWLLGTIMGGAKAAQGENWQNPARKLVKLDLLPEK